mgnify:CR=1 FL=1
MYTINIDISKCRNDGLCLEVCPRGLFIEAVDGLPRLTDNADERCIACGHCIAICPGEAITVNGLTARDCDPIEEKLAVSKEQVVQLFRSRRSIRSYKNEQVDPFTIEYLIDMTRWAPTAKNLQPVHWIVFQNRDDVVKLADMTIEWMRGKEILPYIIDAYDKGRDVINRGAPCLLIAHASEKGCKPVEDCTIALSIIESSVHAFGLGACWAGYFMSAAKEHQPVIDFLDLPLDHHIFGALMLGKPKYKYQRIPPREKAKVQWR